jgi:hypothetical protein
MPHAASCQTAEFVINQREELGSGILVAAGQAVEQGRYICARAIHATLRGANRKSTELKRLYSLSVANTTLAGNWQEAAMLITPGIPFRHPDRSS